MPPVRVEGFGRSRCVGLRGVGMILMTLLALARAADAQTATPSEKMSLAAKSASIWTDPTTHASVILLKGPVKIEMDDARMSAASAVVWLTSTDPKDPAIQNVAIELMGGVKVEYLSADRVEVTRSGPNLLVREQVRTEGITNSADQRVVQDLSKSDLYRQALALRTAATASSADSSTTVAQPGTRPAPRPAGSRPAPKTQGEAPVIFEAVRLETTTADDGTVAIVLNDGVKLVQVRPNNDFIELLADHAVLFTSLHSLREIMQSGGKKQGKDPIIAAYLEGDVKIDYVASRPKTPEQRLTGDRVYYEFATDRAVLTHAIVHTLDPTRGTPMVVQAKLVRQLSQGEYRASNLRLTSSTFAIPSLSLAANEVYVRTEPTGDPDIGDRVVYQANGTSLQAFDIPFLLLPDQSGSMEKGMALRTISSGHLNDFGTSFETEWGLFETLNQLPPHDLDVNYRLDYFTQRGPAAGLNAAYGGGFLTDTTKQPWDFTGDFKSYFVWDKGVDDLARLPVREEHPDGLRGQALWEHMHRFPDDWQVALRAGWVSDPTFLEQWFRRDFQDGPPRDLMADIKHQSDTEAFTIGAVYQPLHLVTTSNQVQEQFEVDRLPDVGYFREGDPLLGNSLTFFSENTGGGLHFNQSRATLAQQGFAPPTISPGLAAEGYTGLTKTVVWRGDFRQEVDFPISAGPLRLVPYVMGRYTQYSTSPQADERARGLAGAGARITTELWKVDPSAESELFDIHQIRHVIEPEINVFTSAMNVQRNQVYVFDPQVDAINDISAAQFALHQRWQTKRGGPGQWRSVDVFSLDVDVDYFGNKPPKTFRAPYDFRGMYFATYPEESIPRDAVNAHASWRLSDNTVLLADTSINLERTNLQTLGVGLLVRRDTRLSYYISNRYVADLNSNITGVHADYQISPKYLIDLDQQFDFTQGKNVYSSASVIRQFDTFFMAFRYYFDETTNQNGISFNIYPQGLGTGVDTSQFNAFHR